MPLLFWNLVYFRLHVVGFTFECSWCSSFFLCLICFSWDFFWVFMFFLCWICFSLRFLFWFVFESTELVNLIGSKLGQSSGLVWFAVIFLIRFVWFKVVFVKYPFGLFWVVFIWRKNVVLPKCDLIKIQKKYIINN